MNFGRSEKKVTHIGLGGEGVLRTFDRLDEARAVILEAIELGVTYFDSAQAYSDSEIYYGSVWKEEPGLRKSVFQTSKSASRSKEGALEDLQNSLNRLHTDYLDLWQIHDVRTDDDLQVISGPGGALEAFIEAREKGIVRYIGVTGHHDPTILTRAVNEWPLDAVLLPVNPIEGLLGGFLTQTLSLAKEKGLAIIGMKVLGGGHYILPQLNITTEMLVRYAMTFDITLSIIGCALPEEVREVVAAVENGKLPGQEKDIMEDSLKTYASGLAFYRGVK